MVYVTAEIESVVQNYSQVFHPRDVSPEAICCGLWFAFVNHSYTLSNNKVKYAFFKLVVERIQSINLLSEATSHRQ